MRVCNLGHGDVVFFECFFNESLKKSNWIR